MPHVEHQLIAGALERLDTLFMEIVERSDALLLSRAWDRASQGPIARTVFAPDSHASLLGGRGRSVDPVTEVRRVWWQKPDCLRVEVFLGSELLGVNVCRGATASSYSPHHRILFTNDSSIQGKRPRPWKRVPNLTLPTIQSGLEQITLLQPPFRAPGWELTSVGGGQQFAGRSTLSLVAHRLQPRTSGADWYWDGIDRFTAIIDEQLGLPFRVAAIVDGQEAAVFSARAFRIDEPVPAHIFQLGPSRGMTVALVHPHAGI